MPAQIIKLEELVPGLEGMTFTLDTPAGEVSYHVPGDLDTEHVTACLKLFEDMLTFQTDAMKLAEDGDTESLSKTADALADLTEKIKAQLLKIFQITNPELEMFPFGQKTAFSILAKVLESFGLAEPIAEGDLPNPPNRATRRASTRDKTKPSSRPAASRTRPKNT